MIRHPRRCSPSTPLLTQPADDLLGKRRSFSPSGSSECPSDSKKSRSVSPKESSQSPVVEAGGSHGHMSPEEHYRRMMSALSEQGTYEEQQQRLYQLASSMGLPGHGNCWRARQEALAAAVRNPAALEAHLPSAGSSSSSSQRRKQGLPQHRDAHYAERELSHPPPLLSPTTTPHIALGPHLRPPFLGMPSALCQTPGYSFLQPAQAEILARQQELLRKQNLARFTAEALLRQKELESLHQRLPPNHPALRSLHDIPEGHPLREELMRRSNAMLVLQHGAAAPLLTLNQQQQPGAPATPKDTEAQGSSTGLDAVSRKNSCRGRNTQLRAGEHAEKAEDKERERDQEAQDEEMKDSDSETDISSGTESPGRQLFTPGSLPFGFPFANPYFHTGSMGGLFTDGEESATANPAEDISKWSVEDVCGFISSLAGCAEYTQVFREQAIDGETLPLLSEKHLLNTMGLKLGPALKIRSQVARRVGRLFYMTGFPLAFPFPPSAV
uniref:Sterile alpha motif domain containing 11 n=1 Tax=Tetraodon nigroviridis TaxID=99883 RepID=H3DCG9_TETNG